MHRGFSLYLHVGVAVGGLVDFRVVNDKEDLWTYIVSIRTCCTVYTTIRQNKTDRAPCDMSTETKCQL